MIVDVVTELRSVGNLCALIQRTPQEIERAAALLGIRPAVRINGVVHFDETGIQRLSDHFRSLANAKTKNQK